MAPVLSSQCILTWRRKKTRRWLRTGKQMPTASSYLCVSLLVWCFTPTQSSQTGLFSAAVASLITVSIQDIQQNPQDTSNFYLANIYATLADPSQSNSTSLPTSPPS